MIIGLTATALTFVALIVSIISYTISYSKDDKIYNDIGRISFYFASSLIAIQAILLMWGILNHQFQWQYVFSYSSTELSTFYLISTFWAGQEGTFLLWLFFGSIYGIIIIKSRIRNESLVMSFFTMVQAFITMILVKKNPFSYVWDLYPANFASGVVPVDGRGLNPLLQDPWMIIHPPVLFVGYSSAMILFAFAMSALITRDFDNWIKRVYPYSLFVALSLGTGIILGGYWAYTTLGWGGYWGWDPVENSSLIPWLTSLALLHGIIIQRRRNALKKTNIFLALLTFLLVLWGSFLTRSGVLADFSVHSFSETVINSYLIGFVIFFSGIAVLTYIFRAKNITSNKISENLLTRGNFMLFGILSLLLSAIFTFLGMNSPLITALFLDQASNVSIDYYNLLNAPVVILIGIFLIIAPLLSWQKEGSEKIKGLKLHFAVSLMFTVFAYFLGLDELLIITIFFLFIFVIFVNGEIIYKYLSRGNYQIGGYLTHVGVGFMLIGIIISSSYDINKRILLPLEEKREILGYEMKYSGFRKNADGFDYALIDVNKNYSSFRAKPRFYWSEYNQSYMRNPSVHNLWFKDLYISPIQIIPAEDNKQQGQQVSLKYSESVYFENYVIKFDGYDMHDHQMDVDDMLIAANFKFSKDGKIHVVKPGIKIQNGQREFIADHIPGTGRDIYIHNINIEDEIITLFIENEEVSDSENKKEMLAIEVTEKPLINLLWFGTFLMIGGMLITIINRIKIKKL